MKSKSLNILIAGTALFLFGALNSQAVIQQYDISVTVTAAPNSPGGAPTINPWSFVALPSTFTGTFDADDTVAGSISNFQLTIGGVNLADTHPVITDNSFDPITLELVLIAGDGFFSAVTFGDTGEGQPANYAVAIENSDAPPLDPYWSFRQNWVGTFSVTQSVPDTGTTALLLGAGLLGLAAIRRRMGRI